MPTLTAQYLDDLARVRLEADDLLPEVVYSIERSIDGGVTWSTVRGATNITDGGVTVVYDYEYSPNVENLYQLVQPLVSDTFERTVGPDGLHLTGVAPSNATTPDAAALDITGNLDISAVINLDDYSTGVNQNLVGKYLTTGNQRSYGMRVTGTGELGFFGSLDGTAILSNPSTVTLYSVGIEDGEWVSVRMTRVAATGVITFYIGDRLDLDTAVWTQMGATVAGTVGNLFSGTAPLAVGSDSGGGGLVTGIIRQVRVRSVIAGTQVANPNFYDQPTGTASFADAAGRTWTINAPANIHGDATGWGDADTGQTWEPYASNGEAVWEVSDGAARIIVVTDPGFDNGRYIDQSFTDAEVVYDVVLTDGFIQSRLSVRGTDASSFTGYQVIFTRNTSGDDTGLTNLAIFIPAEGPSQDITLGPWQLGQRWRIRTRVVGTVIEAKAWNTANPEPSTWHVVRTSTQFASGVIGLGVNLTLPSGLGIFDNFFVHQVPPLAVADAAVTPEQDGVWLKSIAFPSLNQELDCVITSEAERRSRVGLFDVRGRHSILGIADVGSTETFTLLFVTRSQAANVAITGLLTYGAPLLLQSPPDDDPTGCENIAAYPSGWFMPGNSVEARPIPGKRLWQWQVPLTRVAAPAAQAITPAHMTWSVLWQMVNTWVELWDEWATWAELWNATIAPTAMYQALSGGEA